MAKSKPPATVKWRRWEPESSEEPGEILKEAMAAAKARRFEEALAKHLWFHQHALEIRPSLSGVRRSYALSAWTALAKRFPPALTALHRARDKAGRRVKSGGDIWRSFSDFQSINQYLKESARTMRLFKWLVTNDRAGAVKVYHAMEEPLFEAGEFKLGGEFTEAKAFDSIQRGFKVNLRMSQDPQIGAEHAKWARENYSARTLRLIHLLVRNDRLVEARSVARRAGRLFKDKALEGEMKLILKGRVS